MHLSRRCLLVSLAAAISKRAFCFDAPDFGPFPDHPRLFLEPRRARLLKRERERGSIRWQIFQSLIESKRTPPEPGLALALYGRLADEPSALRAAIERALENPADVRQAAIVFDWCQPELTENQSEKLISRLEQSLQPGQPASLSAARDQALAAVALAGHRDQPAGEALGRLINQWWAAGTAPALASGRQMPRHEEVLALYELLHAVRDNLRLDLREAAGDFFAELPQACLLDYYPRPYKAPENLYYLPHGEKAAGDSLRRAELARAGDLCLVAYEANNRPAQFLQGWLMRDSFLMRSAFGIVYELLWANPYIPGLSYHHSPLFFHDKRAGRLVARSAWNEDAAWACYENQRLQFFQDGRLAEVRLMSAKPLRVGEVWLAFVQPPATVTLDSESARDVFIVGLEPGRTYEVRLDENKPSTHAADRGGILHVSLEGEPRTRIQIRPARQ